MVKRSKHIRDKRWYKTRVDGSVATSETTENAIACSAPRGERAQDEWPWETKSFKSDAYPVEPWEQPGFVGEPAEEAPKLEANENRCAFCLAYDKVCHNLETCLHCLDRGIECVREPDPPRKPMPEIRQQYMVNKSRQRNMKIWLMLCNYEKPRDFECDACTNCLGNGRPCDHKDVCSRCIKDNKPCIRDLHPPPRAVLNTRPGLWKRLSNFRDTRGNRILETPARYVYKRDPFVKHANRHRTLENAGQSDEAGGLPDGDRGADGVCPRAAVDPGGGVCDADRQGCDIEKNM